MAGEWELGTGKEERMDEDEDHGICQVFKCGHPAKHQCYIDDDWYCEEHSFGFPDGSYACPAHEPNSID